MVTLLTYLNPTQAALDKTLLDSNEVFCAIADQNANLYGPIPSACQFDYWSSKTKRKSRSDSEE